jgi:cyclase
MNRTLLVAKIAPGSEGAVANVFGRSDQTDLPAVAGIRHRSLYALDDLYVHLMDTDRPGDEALAAARDHPEFQRVSEELRAYISPYRATWQSPKDALATCFYDWGDGDGTRPGGRLVLVARIAPGSEPAVADAFAASDRTELPEVAGILHRSLYALDDVYVHVMDTRQPADEALGGARDHPEFTRVSDALRPYISPYLATWQSPKDAVATCFYEWQRP